MRTAAQALVEALIVNEVELAFCVAGESFIGLLDALRDRGGSCRIITCRHEAGAAIMAEAYGKLTGKPGLCLVSRAPGLCQASLGLHVAYQDSTPLVVVVGQIPQAFQEREAQQELDYRRMLGQLAKWVVQIDQPDRIPELIHRAFTTAASGRPGPVVVAVPEDLFSCATTATNLGPCRATRPSPGEDDLNKLDTLISGAERPLMLLGGSGWTDEACAAIVSFAGGNNLPTCAGYRRADLFDNTHPCYVGELGVGPRRDLVDRVREADLVLAVGTRLSESTTQDYTLFDVPERGQALVHVHPSAEELGWPPPPLSWMQRLKRVFHIDIEHCGVCDGTLRVIACIETPELIEKTLTHLAARETGGIHPLRAPPPRAPGAEPPASPPPSAS